MKPLFASMLLTTTLALGTIVSPVPLETPSTVSASSVSAKDDWGIYTTRQLRAKTPSPSKGELGITQKRYQENQAYSFEWHGDSRTYSPKIKFFKVNKDGTLQRLLTVTPTEAEEHYYLFSAKFTHKFPSGTYVAVQRYEYMHPDSGKLTSYFERSHTFTLSTNR